MTWGDDRWWGETELETARWAPLVEPTLDAVTRARDRELLPHAMLLIGPRGLGRELAAVEIAVLLVCRGAERPWSESPCAERIRSGLHPDVDAVRPAGKKKIITVERVRGIVDSVRSRPFEGERRVWLVDGVERNHLEAPAANALLKTLEEPPPHAVLVLLAANPMAVLPTIRSRCQQLSLPGMTAVARQLAGDTLPPDLGPPGSELVRDEAAAVRSALTAGLGGDLHELVRLPFVIDGVARPFELVAACAVEMAAARDGDHAGEGLARLAADLLAVDRRTRALNLNRKGQMVSSLMRWFTER